MIRRRHAAAGAVAIAYFIATVPTSVADERAAKEHLFIVEETPPSVVLTPDSRNNVLFGDKVVWRNEGLLPHWFEENHGLFSWGPVLPAGGEFQFTPWAMGVYQFGETLEGLVGLSEGPWRFQVRPYAPSFTRDFCPSRPPRRGRIELQWATQIAPEGFAYDVQVRFSGYGRGAPWQWFKRGTEQPAGVFRTIIRDFDPAAHRIATTFEWRARVRDAEDSTQALGWAKTSNFCIIII